MKRFEKKKGKQKREVVSKSSSIFFWNAIQLPGPSGQWWPGRETLFQIQSFATVCPIHDVKITHFVITCQTEIKITNRIIVKKAKLKAHQCNSTTSIEQRKNQIKIMIIIGTHPIRVVQLRLLTIVHLAACKYRWQYQHYFTVSMIWVVVEQKWYNRS